jgi:uncharacterized protein
MIPRHAESLARQLAGEFKVVVVIGPRQSGKTTLARAVFGDRPYVSLEEPDQREFAAQDPRRFLELLREGAVIDEAQRAPDLLSYLQVMVDNTAAPGRFILTGSQHFGLIERITQSLAGRAGFVYLLPFSLPELAAAGRAPATLDEMLWKGSYPPVYDQPVRPDRWYSAYISTYVERDVRQLTSVRDLGTFQRFLALCAASTGQLLNASRLGADVGVTHNTIGHWLHILEASFVVFRLPPHQRNFRKRLVKNPKLYFYDTGLAARLLGIESPRDLATHSLRGALFENWVVAELLKARANRGQDPNLSFWRSHVGHEIDLLASRGEQVIPIEVKAGSTVAADWFGPLHRYCVLAGDTAMTPWLVYGGDQRQQRGGVEVLPWADIGELGQTV